MPRQSVPICVTSGLTLLALFFQGQAWSESTLTPRLKLEETFISNETSSEDESGQITTISPGVLYENFGANSYLTLDYSLNAKEYNELSGNDEVDHTLSMQSEVTHVPNRWSSRFSSNIKQANVSTDGVQIVNPSIQSNNTSELRTFAVDTDFNGRLTNAINFQSKFLADYADFEDSDSTDSVGLSLGLSSNNAWKKLSWQTTLTSRKSSTSSNIDEQIETLQVGLDYRFNAKYSSFISISKSETDNDFLNDTNTNIGILWTPDQNSSFKLGVGKRGNDRTYTLDSLLRSRRMTYTLNYDETVTTSRALLIDENSIEEGIFPSSQGLSITPVLLKEGRVAVVFTGRLTDLSLAYFKQSKSQSEGSVDDEVVDGISINANRRLSSLSSVQLLLSRQETETSQDNVLENAALSYTRQWSKKTTVVVELNKTEQASTDVDNEYDQTTLSFRLNATF